MVTGKIDDWALIRGIPVGKKPESETGEDNVVYFVPSQRVRWRGGKTGRIYTISVKTYPYTVGYHIMLDDQTDRSYPDVLNAPVSEIEPLNGIYYNGYAPPKMDIEDEPQIYGEKPSW